MDTIGVAHRADRVAAGICTLVALLVAYTLTATKRTDSRFVAFAKIDLVDHAWINKN
jgi:hypothetical protein